MTKDKKLRNKRFRALLMASLVVLVLCVLTLPGVAFYYGVREKSIEPPSVENSVDNTTNIPPEAVPQPSDDIVSWSETDAGQFSFSLIAGTTDVYISGVKPGTVFETKYIILPTLSGFGNIIGVSDGAFRDNTNLKGVLIPNSYQYIGVDAFNGCNKLKVAIIGGDSASKSVDKIGDGNCLVLEDGCFSNCGDLESVEIGKNVKLIKASFSNNKSIKEMYIYSEDVYLDAVSKTSFGGILEVCPRVVVYSKVYNGFNTYFAKYYTMTQAEIDGEYFIDYELVNYGYEVVLDACGGEMESEDSFIYQPNTNMVLPTASLENYDFCGWYKTSDYTGDVVEGITEETRGSFTLYAKWEPTEYRINYVLSNGENSVDNPLSYTVESEDFSFAQPYKSGYAFGGWYSDAKYRNEVKLLSDMVEEVGDEVTIYAKFIAIFTGSDYLTGLSPEAKNDTNIVIPKQINNKNVSIIATNAFENGLFESLVIDANISVIQSGAFKNCINLKSVTLNSSSIVRIEEGAFSGCTSLEAINLSTQTILKTIEKQAFYNCASLKSVDLSGTSLTSINSETFKGCTVLTEVKLPTNLIKIYGGAFADCMNLSKVNFDTLSRLSTIGPRAFQNCLSILKVELNNGVDEISEGAFSGCKGLQVVDLTKANTLKIVGKEAFLNCEKLQILKLNDKIEKIEEAAFKNCRLLTSVVFPASLTVIGQGAFANSGVKSIEFVDVDNWFALDSEDVSIEGLGAINVGDAKANAENLKSTYLSKILKKIS